MVKEQEQRLMSVPEGSRLFERRRWAEEEARRIVFGRDELTLECLLEELAEFRAGASGRRVALRERFIWGCALGGLTASLFILATKLL